VDDINECADCESSKFHAYHVLTDTLLTAFYERLAGATSKNVADQFILTTATRVARELVGDSPDPVAKMRELMSSYGCDLGQTQNGDSTNWTVACPFAESVHPKTPKNTMCPIALLFLGAVRLKERESIITMQNLTTDGAKFTIQHKR
jgi:hypothetical protein